MPFTIPGLITEAILGQVVGTKVDCPACGTRHKVNVRTAEKYERKYKQRAWHLLNYCKQCRKERI